MGWWTCKICSKNLSTPPSKKLEDCAPPTGMIKRNIDAFLVIDGWVGLDWKLVPVIVMVKSFLLPRDMYELLVTWIDEAKVMTMVDWLGKRYGFLQGSFGVGLSNCDSMALKECYFPLGLHGILSSCTSFSSIIWSHVKREDNFVAHH